ncbi:MAG TPA: cytochrome c [Cyclobacteriaceae bacterium]|nr:cytochrome c [Cyclobacteriaceae bacterium]
MRRVSFALLALLAFWACNSGSNKVQDGPSIKDITDLTTRQYAIEGKRIYDKLCANCHQVDGSGLGRLIPPLINSDFMQEDIGRTIRLIKYGIEGEIIVNGIEYNQPMPPNPQLTSMEIAQIVTYIYNVWGKEGRLIDVKEVEGYLFGAN